jgi:hypothetical protein
MFGEPSRNPPAAPLNRCPICHAPGSDLDEHIRIAHGPDKRTPGAGNGNPSGFGKSGIGVDRGGSMSRDVEMDEEGSGDGRIDFGWHEKEPNGMQRTWQSLYRGAYSINWPEESGPGDGRERKGRGEKGKQKDNGEKKWKEKQNERRESSKDGRDRRMEIGSLLDGNGQGHGNVESVQSRGGVRSGEQEERQG